MSDALTDREYWVRSYETSAFVEYDLDNDHFRLLFEHADAKAIDTVLEVGSYPAPFLAALGRRGYELNGVDFHPDNATAVPRWLRSRGYRVGTFVSEDFLTYEPRTRFDLVYSLGFIEHFVTFEDVIARHAALVKPGGYLMISTPNFRGVVQRALHFLLDRANLRRHHLPSMRPDVWADVLRARGFRILYAGHYGSIGFWVDPVDQRSALNRFAAGAVARVFWNIRKIWRGNSRHVSTFCGLVAVRESA